MEILIFLIISYILMSIGLFLVFPKANEEGWKGLVPGLNFIVWCKIVGRPQWHAALLLVPIVNLFIYIGMAIDLVRSFGRYAFSDTILAFLYSPAFFIFLGIQKGEQYIGPSRQLEREFRERLTAAYDQKDKRAIRKLEKENVYKKSAGREWIEAIVFAVFAAAFIRMFLLEAYVIPTSSMEGSLLVGDYLFVSKSRYGIRTPKTIMMVPLLHNRLPGVDRESYLTEPDIPYTRLPALESIDRNDPVVFNYPEGDSVYITPGRTFSVYDVRRNPQMLGAVPKRFPLVVRPFDKMDHYIKRCVGVPGDTIQVIDRQLYINGQPADNPENIQFTYQVNYPGATLNTNKFQEWGISEEDIKGRGNGTMVVVLSEEQKEKIKGMGSGITIEPYDITQLNPDPNKLFPYDKKHYPDWTVDNYGPVWVPKKGVTIPLNASNIAFYQRVIDVYENNDFENRNGKFFINGEEATEYTFQMDYYWMMGDNRHNSEDSRVWGFVPHSHVVGKPLFIWLSAQDGNIFNGIRWNRMFTSASK
jgi:signal peptidase I